MFLGGFAGSIPDPSDDSYYPKSMRRSLPWNDCDYYDDDEDDDEDDDLK